MKQASISICNQKGGIGKSTFTMLLASHLHYTLGYDVLVIDCDYPQWSQAVADTSIQSHGPQALACAEMYAA